MALFGLHPHTYPKFLFIADGSSMGCNWDLQGVVGNLRLLFHLQSSRQFPTLMSHASPPPGRQQTHLQSALRIKFCFVHTGKLDI
mmetsp:Transcript_17986/g.31960  ORF Transcript_17986/g.31960 Transcript_17986/m.31960 type:complete len:85 (+) Transcript_17986:376-630(+)